MKFVENINEIEGVHPLSADEFFPPLHKTGQALTYGDVVLATGRSEVPPTEVSLQTRFSKNIPLKIPLASAAMDTVTEHKMAIALACLGGIGVIHGNMTPEAQAEEVGKVKFYLNGFLPTPKCVRNADWKVEDVLNWRAEKGYRYHSFPVLDEEGRLIGLLTESTFRFHDKMRTVRSVMARDLIKATAGTTKEKALAMMRQHQKRVLPVVNPDGTLAGMFTLSDLERIIEGDVLHNTDENDQLRVAAAIKDTEEALERAELLIKARVDALVIETAHGDTVRMERILSKLLPWSKDMGFDIVAGNISEAESAWRLARMGAHAIKVGQGSGSICTTRLVAGVGCPQLSAVYNCARVIRGSGIPIIADGGIRLRHSGDIALALAVGAGSVMAGNLLSGTDETPGNVVKIDGMPFKLYRGMGSAAARAVNPGRYFSGKGTAPEGVEAHVPAKGAVAKVVAEYMGGLRANMGYVGAADLSELYARARFWRQSAAGQEESNIHDVAMVKERE